MRLLHISDVHFGHPAVPEQYESIEALIEKSNFDVVVVSGDLTHRGLRSQFRNTEQAGEAWQRTLAFFKEQLA